MSLDPARFKQLERAGYNRIGPRYLAASRARRGLAEALLTAAQLTPGQRVLDLASGPGLLAQDARAAVGDRGLVIASDISEGQLACCPDLVRVAADGEALPFADGSFDCVMCGLGLMFFPDDRRALAEIRRVLRPQGRLAVSVWAQAGRVPVVECALACIARLLPPPKVAHLSPLRLGSSLPELLAAGGFNNIEVSVCQLDFAFADAAAYWRTFLAMAGGAASGLSRLPDAMKARFPSEVAVELEPYRQGEIFHLQSHVLVATATNNA